MIENNSQEYIKKLKTLQAGDRIQCQPSDTLSVFYRINHCGVMGNNLNPCKYCPGYVLYKENDILRESCPFWIDACGVNESIEIIQVNYLSEDDFKI